MYDKAQPQALGAALVEAILAVADGLDPSDVSAGAAFLSALVAASDDLIADADRGVFDVIAGAAARYAEERANPPAQP